MKQIVGMLVMAAAAASAADLPVRQVVLYKHGVGYFERSGRLAPGESARLDFKASEMNDVLKSLTVEEKGGGKISACATTRASRWPEAGGIPVSARPRRSRSAPCSIN